MEFVLNKNLFEGKARVKASAKIGPTLCPSSIDVFNGGYYNYIATVKLNKPIPAVASRRLYDSILTKFLIYSKATKVLEAYELDSGGQLHLHFTCSSHKKTSWKNFSDHLHKWNPELKSYHFHLKEILTESHWSYVNKIYLHKDDQQTIHQRYAYIVTETVSVLPNVDPESPESDHELYVEADVNFID